jgi:hypothetical protein
MPIAMGRSARRLKPPNAAMCRRSLGQILGNRCFSRRNLSALQYPIRGYRHPTYGLIRRLFLAKTVRSVRPMSLLQPTFRTPEYALFAIFSDPDDPRLFLA